VPIEILQNGTNTGIGVRASSMERLFRDAAMGVMGILVDPTEIESRSSRVISASAESTELLLVEFISELISLVLLDGFAVLDIQIGEIDDGFIVADISGQRDMPANAIKMEIQGVTCQWFEMAESCNSEWRTELIIIS